MLLACFRSSLKSLLRYKCIIPDTFHPDTLCLLQQGCEDLWLFIEAKRIPRAKTFGKHYSNALLHITIVTMKTDRIDQPPESGDALILKHLGVSEDYWLVSRCFVCFTMLIARRVAGTHRCRTVLSHRDSPSSCNNKQSVPQRVITVVSPATVFPFIKSHYEACENMSVM